MTDDEIIKLWKNGLSKNQLALMYKRRFNQRIKLIRLEMRNRHKGRFMSNYQALAHVEKVIYEYIRRYKWVEN